MSIEITPNLRPGRKNQFGQYPIQFRINMDGIVSTKSIGYLSTKEQWNKKFKKVKDSGTDAHPQATLVNAEITRLKNDMEMRYANQRVTGDGTTDVRTVVKNEPNSVGTDPSMKNDANVFVFMDAHINFMCTENPEKHKRGEGRVSVYESILKRLALYLGHKNLKFSQINVTFLQELQLHMTPNYARITIKENMIVLKAFCSMAFSKGVINYNPFKGYVIPVLEAKDIKVKDLLTIDELDMIEEYAVNYDEASEEAREVGGKKGGSKKFIRIHGKKQAAIYLLFGCYTGLRVSDWRRFDVKKHLCEHGIKGMVAKKNGKPVVIPFHPRLERVIEMMKQQPLTMSESNVNKNIGYLMEKLEIDKHISTHCGRKTFAVTMCANQGISLEVCATLMSIRNDTCEKSYYEVTPEKIGKETNKAWGNL